jgi:predicted esterase
MAADEVESVWQVCTSDTGLRGMQERLERMGLDSGEVRAVLSEGRTSMKGAASRFVPGQLDVVEVPLVNGAPTAVAIYVPRNVSSCTGIMLLLHGAGSTGARIAGVMANVGEQCSLILVAPDVQRRSDSAGASENLDVAGLFGRRFPHQGWQYGEEDTPMAALAWARKEFLPAHDRCVICGHSMGAVAALQIAARYWSRFAAVISINGALSMWERFGPDRASDLLRRNLAKVPVRFVHGCHDRTIPLSLCEEGLDKLRKLQALDAEIVAVDDGEHDLGSMNLVAESSACRGLVAWLGALERRRDAPRRFDHWVVDTGRGRAHWVEIVKTAGDKRPLCVTATNLGQNHIDITTSGSSKVVVHLTQAIVGQGPVTIYLNGVAHRADFRPSLPGWLESYRDTFDPLLAADQAVILGTP